MTNLPLNISAGDNLVGRSGEIIVFSSGTEAQLLTLRSDLERLFSDADWTGLVRYVASSISSLGFDSHPPVTCLRITESGAEVFVFGALSIELETDQVHTVSGQGLTTWREVRVNGVVRAVRCGVDPDAGTWTGLIQDGIVRGGGFTIGDSAVAVEDSAVAVQDSAVDEDARAEDSFDSEATLNPPRVYEPVEELDQIESVETTVVDRSELDRIRASVMPVGTPPESAADLSSEPAAPTSAPVASLAPIAPPTPSTPQPSTESAGAPDFESGETTAITGAELSDAVRAARAVAPDPRRHSGIEDQGQPTGIPELRGVSCPNGHLASLQDTKCRTCSVPVDASGAIRSGQRPILGIVEFDDGVRIPLDRPIVIGREPPKEYYINGEQAYVIPLSDRDGLISRIHVEVHLVGWDVELIDKNSINGTFTSSSSEATSRTRLRPEHPTQLDLDTLVYVGDRVFRFVTGVLGSDAEEG